MSTKLEILSSDITVVGQGDFTVNNAVNSVAVNSVNFATGLDFFNAINSRWFTQGDNIILTGIWISTPYQFAQSTGLCKIGIQWMDDVGVKTPIGELSLGSALDIPDPCGMLEFPPGGLFIITPKTGSKRKLILNVLELNLSQLNAPASLNGSVFPVQVFVRLNHTIQLTPTP